VAAALVDLRIVAHAQIDRIHVERDGELVHRRFLTERAARLSGRARIGRRAHVHAHQPVLDLDVGAGVHEVDRRAGRLHELVGLRSMRVGRMLDCKQMAVPLRGITVLLTRRRTMTDRGEHLPPCEDQLDRPLRYARRERGQRGVRPRLSFAAKTSTDERIDDMHVFRRELEELCEILRGVAHALRSIVDRELVTVP